MFAQTSWPGVGELAGSGGKRACSSARSNLTPHSITTAEPSGLSAYMRAPSADARPGTHRFLFAALGLHGFLKLARLVGLFLGTAPLLRLYSGFPRCQHNIGVKLFTRWTRTERGTPCAGLLPATADRQPPAEPACRRFGRQRRHATISCTAVSARPTAHARTKLQIVPTLPLLFHLHRLGTLAIQ